MSERKYTDEQIVKALTVCISGDSCKECPTNPHHGNYGYCTSLAIAYALDLINRQKAEIERLKAEQMMAEGYADALEERAKADAIKAFAVRLQKSYYDLPTMSDEEGEYDYVCMEALDEFIDNLVAEMTEGK